MGKGTNSWSPCRLPGGAMAPPPRISRILSCANLKGMPMSSQFALPHALVQTCLVSDHAAGIIPNIGVYARRPVFDEHFVLRGPGWHPDAGMLVHGPSIEPASLPVVDRSRPMRDRVPIHLRLLLQDFCFLGDVDYVNAVGGFLTGVLANLFVAGGKGLLLLDGNQPELGKTLLARVMAILLDGQ